MSSDDSRAPDVFGGCGNADGDVGMTLIRYCREGREDGVDRLLNENVSVCGKDDRGRTGLMHACEFGFQRIVDALIEHGADVGAKDNAGKTPLMIASEYGRDGVVKSILKRTCDATQLETEDEDVCTALTLACKNGHEMVVESLVKHGADTNAVTSDGNRRTPLSFAASNVHVNVVKLLLDLGAEIDKPVYRDGHTALMIASRFQHEEMIELLLSRGASVHKQTVMEGNVLLQSFDVGDSNTKILDALVRHGADVNFGGVDNYPPLVFACKMYHENVVKFLLENGADVNVSLEDSENVLFFIGREQCWNEKNVQLLLHHGAEIHARNDFGTTVLMNACMSRQDEMVKVLLERGVDLDPQCNMGQTAAMCAAEYGGINCLKALIAAGADLGVTSTDGSTALSYAMSDDYGENLDCVRILLTEGVLLKGGELKTVHKNARYHTPLTKAVKIAIELGVFEWTFCDRWSFKPVCFVAMESGICPGKIEYDGVDKSPLVVAFLENEKEAISRFLQHLYFFPEDFMALTTDKDLRAQIPDPSPQAMIGLEPMTLFTWSFLTVSKAISRTGPPNRRSQWVEALCVPLAMKNRLKSKLH